MKSYMTGCMCSLVFLLGCPSVWAQPAAAPDARRFLAWPFQDAAAVVRGVERAHLMKLAGTGSAFLLALRLDDNLRAQAATFPSEGEALRLLDEMGNVRRIRPVVALVFVGTLATHNRKLQDAAFTSLQSMVYANLVTGALKGIAGRARPRQEEGPAAFRPFSGDTSFPSGHATTVFAVLTPWFVYYPSPYSASLMALAGGVAVTRLSGDYHWFTDVVAGGAIGFTTGYLLSRQHLERAGLALAPVLGTREAGVRVTF